MLPGACRRPLQGVRGDRRGQAGDLGRQGGEVMQHLLYPEGADR